MAPKLQKKQRGLSKRKKKEATEPTASHSETQEVVVAAPKKECFEECTYSLYISLFNDL